VIRPHNLGNLPVALLGLNRNHLDDQFAALLGRQMPTMEVERDHKRIRIGIAVSGQTPEYVTRHLRPLRSGPRLESDLAAGAAGLVEQAKLRQRVETVAAVEQNRLAATSGRHPKGNRSAQPVHPDILGQIFQLSFRHQRKQISGRMDAKMFAPGKRRIDLPHGAARANRGERTRSAIPAR
jgi:hypothetical protein